MVKKINPRKAINSRYGFDNKLHDITREDCKETPSSKAHTIIKDDIPTNYDSNEIYIIPNDGNLDTEYINMEYSKGILLIQCTSLISGVDGPFIFC